MGGQGKPSFSPERPNFIVYLVEAQKNNGVKFETPGERYVVGVDYLIAV